MARHGWGWRLAFFAVALWAAVAAVPAGAATVQGADDPSASLVIDPGSDGGEMIPGNPYWGMGIYRLRMPSTKVVKSVTLGDFGPAAGACNAGAPLDLSINDISPTPGPGAGASAPLPSTLGRMTWKFGSPVKLLEGHDYSFRVAGGCVGVERRVWDHGGQVDGPSGPCQTFPQDYLPRWMQWHVQGRDDADSHCSSFPTGIEPDMPTGWVHMWTYYLYPTVIKQDDIPWTNKSCAPEGSGAPQEAQYWKIDTWPGWPVRESVCYFRQWAPPGEHVADGWHYATPFGYSEWPKEMYVELESDVKPPKKYVAMGDSFSSGEGAGDYEQGTDEGGVNQCHRSAHAYPRIITTRADGGLFTGTTEPLPFSLDFVACSGAKIDDLSATETSSSKAPWNEGAQLAHLDEDTGLVTVGIGGNDLGFAPTLKSCIVKHSIIGGSCQKAFDADVQDRMLALDEHGVDGFNRLQRLYDEIFMRAPRSRVMALGYPRFFPANGGSDRTTWVVRAIVPATEERCQFIRVTDQLWINERIRQLNTIIESSARSIGAEFVQDYDASDQHELCNGKTGGDLYLGGPFFNGITLPATEESFHPSPIGQGKLAQLVLERFNDGPQGGASAGDPAPDPSGGSDGPFTVHQGQTIATTRDIAAGSERATFHTEWPGSDIVMMLRSPSGRVFRRSSPAADDVYHRARATSEVFSIAHPEAGSWTVELYGADVRPGGEPTTLDVFAEQPQNREPVAQLRVTSTRRDAVVVDAAGSTDPDGHLIDYLWDFGDGTYATGAQASHTYEQPGDYRITLAVKDDRGGLGFASADHDVSITPFAFNGFDKPIENRPAVNQVKAGQGVPVKFGLGGDQGRDIFDPGYPRSQRIDCATGEPIGSPVGADTPGSSALTYDGRTGRYQYVWKTDKAWAGTCRRLTMGLADTTRHAADFRLR